MHRTPASPSFLSQRPACARAADVATARFVKLPSWFTVGSARRVMQAKGVRHALVEQGGRLVGSVEMAALLRAPEQQVLAQRMIPSMASVPADASVEEALARLTSQGTDCLPVVAGVMLVGVVTREDLEVAGVCGSAGDDLVQRSHAA
jgi:Mg/Co/Ni transporter MgtE